jgi:hypothetical protein
LLYLPTPPAPPKLGIVVVIEYVILANADKMQAEFAVFINSSTNNVKNKINIFIFFVQIIDRFKKIVE